jgi:hypothetical protein
MCGQLWCCIAWLLGADRLLCVGALLLGPDAAIATAPKAPPAATTVAAEIANNIRFELCSCNRSSFPSRVPRTSNHCRLRNP